MNINEVSTYLGYKGNDVDEKVLKEIEEVNKELTSIVTPKSIFKKFSSSVYGNIVKIEDLAMESSDLGSHLKDCSQVVLLAVTLGVATDTYIRKCSVENMAKATIASAVSSSLCEEICDSLMEEIKRETNSFLTPRFSPGYGDLSLEYQKDILKMLNCSKTIGLTLTDSLMLVPTKSVTAFVGLTENENCSTDKCRLCKNAACEFRKE